MPLTVTDYIKMAEHAIAGTPDSRISSLVIVNQALSFLVNMHDWKFRKRPPLDVCFQSAGAPTIVALTSLSRSSNIVTAVAAQAPVPGFSINTNAPKMTLTGCTDTTFNGQHQVVSVISTVSATWAQTGADATVSGTNCGYIGAYPYEQHIDLPDDFGELLSVCTKNNAIANIINTGLPEIAWRRGTPNAVAYDGLYRCALSFPGQTSGAYTMPIPRLEIWPRPAASNSLGDLTLTYRARGIPLDNGTASSYTVPNIPDTHERLLCLLVRLFAQGYEEEVVQEDPLVQAEVAMLLEADGRQDMDQGPIKGGAVHRKAPHQIREFRIVSDPENRRG
jgi:hypothetical protein